MTNDAERVSDIEIVAELRDLCRDWNGEPIVDGSTPRYEPHVGLLRQAADIIEAQSKALAEARAIIAKYWDGVDMLNDGPDDSDVAYAMGQIGEAHKLAGPIAETYRTSIIPTPENPNG